MNNYISRKQLQKEIQDLKINSLHKDIICNAMEEKFGGEIKKLHNRNNIQDSIKFIIVVAMVIGYLAGEISFMELLKNSFSFLG